MNKRCLYCYQPLDNSEKDFHQRCSLAFFGTAEAPEFAYSLDQMAELAKNIVERSVSVPGVQPKLSLTLVKDTVMDGARGRLTVVGALGGNYIFKPPHNDYPEMPQNEHLTMRIAEAFGIPVVPSSMIRLSSGELAYITRRIDRTADGKKIHMLDMFQILEAFDKYRSSMERVGKAFATYSDNPLLDLGYFFDLTVFSFLTGNNDMHLKNFSMIVKNGSWVIAPAYDLLNVSIVNPDDKEELALTLDAKKSKLTRTLFAQFGQKLGLTDRQINGSFRRMERNHDLTINWVDQSFLSEGYRQQYKELLEIRYQRLNAQIGQ
ncbi:MAG TPA: HipA domain-containing protein [Puia sp.]